MIAICARHTFLFPKPAQKIVAILAVIFNVTHQNTLPATAVAV